MPVAPSPSKPLVLRDCASALNVTTSHDLRTRAQSTAHSASALRAEQRGLLRLSPESARAAPLLSLPLAQAHPGEMSAVGVASAAAVGKRGWGPASAAASVSRNAASRRKDAGAAPGPLVPWRPDPACLPPFPFLQHAALRTCMRRSRMPCCPPLHHCCRSAREFGAARLGAAGHAHCRPACGHPTSHCALASRSLPSCPGAALLCGSGRGGSAGRHSSGYTGAGVNPEGCRAGGVMPGAAYRDLLGTQHSAA